MPHTGPLSGPSSTAWRRERLLRIGSNSTLRGAPKVPESESDAFHAAVESLAGPQDPQSDSTDTSPLLESVASYGTILRNRSFLSSRRNSITATAGTVPSAYLRRVLAQRPISAYDVHFMRYQDDEPTKVEAEADAKINGIRVWYSSFSSIDWLHDAIKDSVRFSRLRRRTNLRARIRLAFDRSAGWFIVTIVGFLTAIVAYMVVRSEQWLFDSKEGYCCDTWWKAKRLCCPYVDADGFSVPHFLSAGAEAACPAWRTWADVFSGASSEGRQEIVESISYTAVALLLAFVSCILTIYLTASTSFITRKESGVLAPGFSESDDPKPADQGLPPRTANTHSFSANTPKRKVMYYAAGSGIPEIKTILSGFVIHGYLGFRTLFTKAVGLSLSVASGLSLGKEGPFVHIASCVGNIVSRFISKYENNEAKRREILSAACAAGVAVAFGAPIGGTLFSLEEVSYFFPPKVMWRSFFCAMIAAVTLKFLDPFGTGKLVLFQVTYDKDWHAWELLPFFMISVIGGIYGAYFSKLNILWSKEVRSKTWMKTHPILEVLLITLLTSILCFLNPYTRMGGPELVYNLFAECHMNNTHEGLCVSDPGEWTQVWPVVHAILTAMFVKGALTVITFGIKVPAGIFIPTLGVGACVGRVVGILVQYLRWTYPDNPIFQRCEAKGACVIPGLYAMVGAAAALSGVTRTTVSLAVIMFELTDTLTYAVPVMLAVLVSKTVADALEPKGIYDLVIEMNQFPYLDAKHEYLWGCLAVHDVIDRDVDVIQAYKSNTVRSLRDQLQNLVCSGNDDSGFPILRKNEGGDDDEGVRMIGYIGANELEHALSIVADQADEEVAFHHLPTALRRTMSASTTSSLDAEARGATSQGLHTPNDPLDFSIYMDQAPLTISNNSPLELVHQFFAKLGARYVVVTDAEGLYEGVIDKKTWLAFLSELEEKT